MSAEAAIAAIAPRAGPSELLGAAMEGPFTQPAPRALQTGPRGFGEFLVEGLAGVEAKIEHANDMVTAFAIDDSIPVHEVTIALEEARLAVELALQVRNRLVEGYREIMNMQL
jgi:flagellar hook-basal body complex protein FliE